MPPWLQPHRHGPESSITQRTVLSVISVSVHRKTSVWSTQMCVEGISPAWPAARPVGRVAMAAQRGTVHGDSLVTLLWRQCCELSPSTSLKPSTHFSRPSKPVLRNPMAWAAETQPRPAQNLHSTATQCGSRTSSPGPLPPCSRAGIPWHNRLNAYQRFASKHFIHNCPSS